MTKHLLLVDYENVHRIDLSVLDDSYRAIIFVGASQNPPKAARSKATAHRFSRVEFHKIAGSGKNALDFHIAFHLGRTFETAPDTVCIVVSADKGYDPLLLHLNNNGLKCSRIDSFDALLLELVVCGRCNKASTIEHHGGRWCTNCGSFASPPNPNLLPSRLRGYREPSGESVTDLGDRGQQSGGVVCDWCHQRFDISDGIYDDGDFMCGDCIAQYAR